MTCQNCVRHVREVLQAVPGVRRVEVDLSTGETTVNRSMESNGHTTQDLIDAVAAAGFTARAVSAGVEASTASRRPANWDQPLILGVVVTLFLAAGEWIFGWHGMAWFAWTGFVLGSLVQFHTGREFYVGAWNQLKRRRSSMDTLVALGSTAAYLLSVAMLFRGGEGHLHFLDAATIVTVIRLGHWIEARVSRRSEDALRSLMALAPETALRQEKDGSEKRVPVSALGLNDAVVLRPGDAIPTDGTVIEGESAVDEAMLTGESMPVDKRLHDRLYAGTHNLNARIVMLVTGIGEQTALARIIEAVYRAQTSRANIQRLADRISSIFVPLVIVVALLTAAAWMFAPETMLGAHAALAGVLWQPRLPEATWVTALMHLAAVLIVACPCAMGLATPAAIMVSANTAARRGILVRDGVALEKAGYIDTVVFDKTGTLTVGEPRLMRFVTYLGDDARPALDEMRVAVSLARMSSHPVCKAVAGYGCEPYAIRDCREIRGRGMEALLELDAFQTEPYVLRLGSLKWLGGLGTDFSRAVPFINEWAAKGGTLLGIAVNQHLMGVIAVRDGLKPGAAEVIDQLRRRGCLVCMITGDHPASARAIAREVGIDEANVFAEAGPDAKPELVANLQSSGRRVAFVGDGINDAPALERSDLGIAVQRASDISRNASDLVLLRSDIGVIPEALGLARVTLRKIRQNLFWAFFYNVAAIPLAALGFLSPMLCAVLMGFSDLVVLGNALTLNWWRPQLGAPVKVNNAESQDP
ncbi:MAG TPA: heavy metal translocating P-type ATPase [Verrucomicrobiales bacterium]|nr:heavy metal translocating P-type ATPase [Verrucomicrobiales bacterium]